MVAIGASVSSRGAVNSSVQREREREGMEQEREGEDGGRERGRGWSEREREREGMEGGAFKPKLRRYVERKLTNSVM